MIHSPSANLSIFMGDLEPLQLVASNLRVSVRIHCLQPGVLVRPFIIATPSGGFVVARHVSRVFHLMTGKRNPKAKRWECAKISDAPPYLVLRETPQAPDVES